MNLTSIDEMILKGWGHAVTAGAFSDGVAGGGAAAVLDLDRPRLAIGVPAGICIRPIRMAAQIQQGAVANGEEAEVLFAVDSLGLWRGDGTYTVEIPSNLRTDVDKGSMCRVGSVFAADMTTTPGYAVEAPLDPVLDMELARKVVEVDVGSDACAAPLFCDLTYEPEIPPYLVGPCTLFCYFGGDTAIVDGYAQVWWVEGPKDRMLPPV